MSSKRSYFKMAYGIEETEEKVYIEDVEKEAVLLDGAGTELMAEEAANDKLMNTLVEDSKTVDEMYGIMEKGIETTDGINSDTETMVVTAIESILRRHGMKRHIAMPRRISVEAFDTKRGRLQAAENLRVSLEGIFSKIKEGILKLWEWLKKMWAKFFGKNNKKNLITLEQMAEYILGVLDKVSEDALGLPRKIVFSRDPDKGGKLEDNGKFVNITKIFNSSSMDKQLKNIEEDYKKFLACLDAIVEKNKAKSVNLTSGLIEEANLFSEYRKFDGVVIESKSDIKEFITLTYKTIIPTLKKYLETYEDQINDKMAAAESVIQQIAPGAEASEKDRGLWGNILAKFGKEKPQDVLRIIRQQSTKLVKNVNEEIASLSIIVVGAYKMLKSKVGSLDKE